MPVAFHCSCGHHETFPDIARGQERDCAECGRLFRVPLSGDSLRLRTQSSVMSKTELQEAEDLIGITPNALLGIAGRRERRRKRRIWLFLAGIIFGMALGVIYYFII